MRTSFLFGFGAAAGLAAVGLALAVHGADAEGLLYATRWTARLSVLLFATVFAARGLYRLAGPVALPLLTNRRGLGLAFAAAHLVHLGALSSWFAASGERPLPVTIVGGGLAYALIVAMALTSTDAAQRRMGRWWKRLHLTGLWYVWLIFFQSYLGRALGGPERMAQGIYGVTLLLLALGLRLAPRLIRRPAAARG
jgi:DMSO/TMAO reductase YedYZ heme-binding membrane subunit